MGDTVAAFYQWDFLLFTGYWRGHCTPLCSFWVSFFFEVSGIKKKSSSIFILEWPWELNDKNFSFLRNQPTTAAALLKGGADGNKLNKNKCSPLHVAVNKGYTGVVKTLLSYSCNVNAQVCVLVCIQFRLCHITCMLRKAGIFSMLRAWDKEKLPTGIEPMTFRTPIGRSNHWATGRLVASIGHIYWVHGDMRPAYC